MPSTEWEKEPQQIQSRCSPLNPRAGFWMLPIRPLLIFGIQQHHSYTDCSGTPPHVKYGTGTKSETGQRQEGRVQAASEFREPSSLWGVGLIEKIFGGRRMPPRLSGDDRREQLETLTSLKIYLGEAKGKGKPMFPSDRSCSC